VNVIGKLMKTPILIIVTTLLLSFITAGHEDVTDKDSTFIAWNKATIASLRFQIAHELQPKANEYYKNRLEAFYGYIDIQTDSQINVNSIRYKFLDYIKEEINRNDVFIIEANLSGEHVDIRNFILYPKQQDHVDIELYRFNLSGWRRDTVIKDFPQSISANMLNQRVKWPNGLNYDDVTISHFQKGNLKSVEFFLFNTLSSESVIKIMSKR